MIFPSLPGIYRARTQTQDCVYYFIIYIILNIFILSFLNSILLAKVSVENISQISFSNLDSAIQFHSFCFGNYIVGETYITMVIGCNTNLWFPTSAGPPLKHKTHLIQQISLPSVQLGQWMSLCLWSLFSILYPLTTFIQSPFSFLANLFCFLPL